MTDSTDLPVDPQDRLYEPPLVDQLSREADCFAIGFVPEDWVSAEEKCFVRVSAATSEGNRILTLISQIEERWGKGKIHRIVHGGGGDYTLSSADNDACALQDLEHKAAGEIADRLHQIAQASQIAYRIHEEHLRSRSA